MKQLVAAVITLTLVVSGIVLATSLSSSAQEDGGTSGDTTTTTTTEDGESTIPEDEVHGIFDFRFGSEIPAELEELKSCLAEQGIDIPDDVDRGFRFELRGLDGVSEALEACGLPTFDPPFSFEGELPEGFPFGGEFLEDFELPEGFPFDGDFELPDGFAFGGPGDGFGFGFGAELLDRDALATCLAELGSFDNVDEVRAQLDECLPEGPIEGEFGDHHRFGGPGFGGWFGFDFAPEEVVPEGADT